MSKHLDESLTMFEPDFVSVYTGSTCLGTGVSTPCFVEMLHTVCKSLWSSLMSRGLHDTRCYTKKEEEVSVSSCVGKLNTGGKG